MFAINTLQRVVREAEAGLQRLQKEPSEQMVHNVAVQLDHQVAQEQQELENQIMHEVQSH